MFVVFEGIDGSGKTTVSNQVAERLRASGLGIKHLRADGKFASAISEAIRDLGRDARNVELAPQTEFLLYVARDVQLIEETLRPALQANDVVLADRFLFTAEILARKGRHLSRAYTAPVLETAAGGIKPDLVVLVDVDPVLARARRKAHKIQVSDKRPPSRKGLSGVGLQHRIRRGYLELAAEDPGRWVVVTNEDSLEETVARVTELLLTAQRSGAATAIEAFRRAAAAGNQASAPKTPRSLPDALTAFLGWIDRRVEREPRVAAYLMGGLFGAAVDERRQRLAKQIPEAVLASLDGLPDDVSWQLREALASAHGPAVLRSISGIPNSEARAEALRKRLIQSFPGEVAESLAHLDDELSWAYRERLYADHPNAVMGSLSWLDSPRAWALRERWLSDFGARLAKDYDVSRIAAKSVNSVGGERGWQIRELSRAAAPVAALTSLGTLDDEQSFRWRTDFLRLAPKVVMGTLKRFQDARSYEMRRQVAADCKEAIDSIQNLDDQEAWALREQHADTWPSTVAKSLGVTADSERGQAFLLRQLAAHPANVSLLKHASAFALGTHRVSSFED